MWLQSFIRSELSPHVTTNTCRIPRLHSQRICLESICNVILHAALPCLKGHGAVKLTGHCGTCQCFLALLPQEQCHLLALIQHGPHKQVIEVKGNQHGWSRTMAGAQRDLPAAAAAGRHHSVLQVRGVGGKKGRWKWTDATSKNPKEKKKRGCPRERMRTIM